MSGLWELLFDGSVVGSGRVGPGGLDSHKPFNPAISAANGVVIELKFKARPGSPIVDVDGFIDASNFT